MNDFFLFLFFIDGILGLILFVKVWSMTSDVRSLKDHFCVSYYDDVKKKFAEYYLCGEYDEAYKFLNHYIFTQIDENFHCLSRNSNNYQKDYADFIAKLINSYSRYYELIGKEVPENLKNVTYESYDKIS